MSVKNKAVTLTVSNNQTIVKMPVHRVTVCANKKYDPLFHYVDIWAMTGDKPTNDSRRLRWRDVEQRGLTFAGQPILCSFPNGSTGVVGNEHDFSDGFDQYGNIRRSYVQNQKDLRMVGYIQPLEVERPRMEKEQSTGETWLVLPGKISKNYYPELTDDLEKKGIKGISIEAMTPQENIVELENGEIEHSNWFGIGVAILGDKVLPAFEKAKAVNRMIPNESYSYMSASKTLIQEFESQLNIEITTASAQNKPNKNKKKRSDIKTLMAKKNKKQILNEFAKKLERHNFVPYELAYNSNQEIAAVIGKKGNEIYPYSFCSFDKEDKFIDDTDFMALSLSADIQTMSGETEEIVRVNVDTLMSELTELEGYKKKSEELTSSVSTLTAEIESKNETIFTLKSEIKEMKDKEMEDKATDEMEKHNEMYEDEDCKKITEQASSDFIARIKADEFKGNKDSMLSALKVMKADLLDNAQVEINRLSAEKKKQTEYSPFSITSDYQMMQRQAAGQETGILDALSATMGKNNF